LIDMATGRVNVSASPFASAALTTGTLAPLAVVLALAIATYLRTHQTGRRRGIVYWTVPVALSAAGSALLLAGLPTVGHLVHLATAPFAAYVAMTQHLPSVRRTARTASTNLIAALLVVGAYVGGFIGLARAFPSWVGAQPLVVGALLAVTIAIAHHPLLRVLQQLYTRLIPHYEYAPDRIVREYSARIDNIVELQRLAGAVAEALSDAVGAREAIVLTVTPSLEEGIERYTLESIPLADKAPLSGTLSSDSPFARAFDRDRRAVTQNEIELLPELQDAPPAERAWLSSLALDVYLPLHSQERWIGLLGVGAMSAGTGYADSGLALLASLADRTAPVLENARLVEELRQALVRAERSCEALQQAHRTLEQRNADLQSGREALEARDRLQSGFIGTLTDRLRAPFTNLSFAVQLLERHGLERWSQDQRDQLAQVIESIALAKQMADSVVTFASLLNSDAELSLQELDFGALVEDAIQPLRSLARHKEIDLCTELTGPIPAVRGDREWLTDAVYHLVQNALTATPPGGQVIVHCLSNDGSLRFNVHDTGRGVPAGELPGLWLRFRQTNDPPLHGAPGLGLGLALAYLVVEAHGGDVHAASERGYGSDFGFSLPLEPMVLDK
jgi:signal transduction histidine kinase